MQNDHISRERLSRWVQTKSLKYFFSAALVVLATLAGFPLQRILHPTNLIMLYLVVIVIAAFYMGRGPAIVTALLGMVAFDFFFIDPRLTLTIGNSQYFLTLFGFLLVGLIISTLTVRLKDQVEIIKQRELQTSALYSLSRDLATSAGLDKVFQVVIQHGIQMFDSDIFLLFPHNGSDPQIHPQKTDFTLNEEMKDIAKKVYRGEISGTYITTLHMYFMALETITGIHGTLLIKPKHEDTFQKIERQQLQAYSSLAALAIERTQLEEQANQTQVYQATERLQTSLLNSISHDLRTPLATISGVLDSLYEAEIGKEYDVLDHEARQDLLQTAREEAYRLNRLVGNLLDMTRLEADALHLHLEKIDIQDLIGASLGYMSERINDHPIQISLEENLPVLSLDFVLMEQVIVNLLDNSAKYSPAGSPIEIKAQKNPSGRVNISILDHGIGLPEEELENIFIKFYRIKRSDGTSGTGLGLSICKGIVEAHGGKIWAENRPGGGLMITLTLPPAETDTEIQKEY